MDAYARQQINIKIDHHFNANHRLTGNWIRESHYTDNNNLSPWPTGYGGEVRENPRVRTLQLTSTLTPSLLNEFRYGYRVTSLEFNPAIISAGEIRSTKTRRFHETSCQERRISMTQKDEEVILQLVGIGPSQTTRLRPELGLFAPSTKK
jgi:hypothetical protein